MFGVKSQLIFPKTGKNELISPPPSHRKIAFYSPVTKSSIKWANLGQLTPKKALRKDYTSDLNIMQPKLGQSAKKISKKSPIEKKNPLKISQNLGHWPTLRHFLEV